MEELQPDQRRVYDAVMMGESVFFTGVAGTGKSFLLKVIINAIRERLKGTDERVFVTASTGAAAVNIAGTTIHSFSGIGVGSEDAATIAMKLRRRKGGNWPSCRVLVIDEVSMLSARLFDLIESVARMVRRDRRPFGGIQVILTGDFLQLPPVSRDEQARFAFEAAAWPGVVGERVFELTHVHRQRDQRFVRVLNAIRLGQLTSEAEAVLDAAARNTLPDGALPVKLYPFRRDVDRDNSIELRRIDAEAITIAGVDTGADAQRRLLEHCPAPLALTLKKGAQVMLLKNLDVGAGLCNGATGVVLEIKVRPEDLAQRKAHVAHGYPIVDVRFSTGAVKAITPEEWTVGQPESRASAKRRQVPLALSWAMTIHKCQGSTLDMAEIDLGNAFEAGQAYVALSRVRAVEGLKLVRWDRRAVFANDRAVEWYRVLRGAGQVGPEEMSETELDTPEIDVDVVSIPDSPPSVESIQLFAPAARQPPPIPVEVKRPSPDPPLPPVLAFVRTHLPQHWDGAGLRASPETAAMWGALMRLTTEGRPPMEPQPQVQGEGRRHSVEMYLPFLKKPHG
ncbi:DNA helicase Pif1 like [Carpediemonas membranifera]|uniref:ATP-dependent DNA helicase n=1 Tax=Carpediemonas membranifera TaxID=201153 RepID=A0A8J6B649_9EUKA|nr:DNA helicase Pif1 like [Carpediemonas membranifera]|eukprot:KAG9395074.1 DNA helicase Pif1 like [Carpediemonas membranifera]